MSSGAVSVETQAHVHRQITGAAQIRKYAGIQQRRFSQAGLTEQHGKRFAFDQTKQIIRFGFAAVEEHARVFGERQQTRPRAFGVDHRKIGHGNP